ncbi:MAG: transglycosylase domain-containing protein [Anaerolineales bacterium]|nr:transglycosylase domain-containing protein [Anaerolineales bacterium]
MSRAQKPIQIRRRKRRLTPRNSGMRLGLSCGLVLCFTLFLLSISIAWAYSNITQDLPSPEVLRSLLDPSPGHLLTPTRIYDRSGAKLLTTLNNSLIGQNIYLTSNPNLASKQNDLLDFQNIPPILILTTVAASDPGFWNHAGFSLNGFFTQEHPTIAQRLVNDFLLWQESPGIRKAIRERLLAAQITSLYGREKILEWFINYADYGYYTFGAADASKAYFNKEAGNLTLTEAAILAATAEAPLLNPWDAAVVAHERGNLIIQSMLANGWISQEQADKAALETFLFDKPLIASQTIAPDFIDYTLSQLENKNLLERVKRGGFIIITTLDYTLQAQTECAINAQINLLRGEGEIPMAFTGEECLAANLLPTLVGENVNTGQAINTGVLIVQPQNGEILTMTSVNSQNPFHWFPGAFTSNSVWQEHSTGTILTPLVYLTALTRGFTLASLVWDIPPQEPLSFPNPDDEYHGPMRLRIALVNDYMPPALEIIEQIGVQNVKSIAKQFGIPLDNSVNSNSASEILINSNAPLLEITQFYAAIANQGNQRGWIDKNSTENHHTISVKPVAVLSVEDEFGNTWIDNTDELKEKTVTTPQLAYLLTDALSDKASTWQTLGHPNVLEVGFQAAAKQGKTYSSDSSAWTIGYTPELVVSVWTGKNTQATEISSPEVSSSLWRAIMQFASKIYPPSSWETPSGITKRLVCDPSGMLPSTNCSDSVEEVFMAGTEPTEADTLFQSLEVNRETDLLATVFTPADLIENKVFIDFPAEAMSWAVSSGLDVPPISYDVISPGNVSNSNVKITSPTTFAYVGGEVDIKGTAKGDGFQYYRLQVGKGVNPSQWLQIGEDVMKPVSDGLLMKWDTSQLDGLYAIQLTVIQNENRIENTFSQVTVDNQPPDLSIIYPQDKQKITLNGSSKVTIQLDINDNLGIDQVDILIDEKSIATLYQSPFAYSWEAKMGDHTLLVKAIDMAGNISESNFSFSISP